MYKMKLSSLLTVGTALFTIVVVRESDAANVVQCGDIIGEKTKLNDHLECDCNNGPALIVKSAKLNMNKKNVSCQEGTSVPYENNKGERQGVITLLGKKSKVSNGFVIGNNDQTSHGVVLGGVGKHQLSNVEAVSFDIGILIDEYSSKNTISKCLSKDSNGYGFFVSGNSNTLEQNVATSNNYDGFVVYGNSNTLKQNVATSNKYGFYVSGNKNTLQQNEAKENVGDGFYVNGNSNVLKRNEATGNKETGFVINKKSTGNTVKKNKAAENGRVDYKVNCMATTFVKNKGNDPCSVG
mmetsp:Transcript_14080/g.15996  ORF Transcript_14080/g.15996 Transcript_14080/m.15996 type:complete len:296 (-) Transcript_14080:83-970(-)